MLDPRAGIRKAGAMQPLMALLKEVVEVGTATCCAAAHNRVDMLRIHCCACDTSRVNLSEVSEPDRDSVSAHDPAMPEKTRIACIKT